MRRQPFIWREEPRAHKNWRRASGNRSPIRLTLAVLLIVNLLGMGGGEDAPGDEPRGDKKSSKKDKKDKKGKRASDGDNELAKKPRTGDDADYSNVAPPKSVDTKTKPQLTWLQQQRQLQHKERQANRGHKHKLGAKARKRARAREAKAAAAGGGGGD